MVPAMNKHVLGMAMAILGSADPNLMPYGRSVTFTPSTPSHRPKNQSDDDALAKAKAKRQRKNSKRADHAHG